MDSKGVSGVITAVLLILLVIASIGILWVVIAVFVSDSGSEIGGGINSVGLSVDGAYIEGENFYVKVRRDNAKGELEGVRVLLEDGSGSVKGVDDLEFSLREGEAKSLSVNNEGGDFDGLDLGDIVKISVFPIVNDKAGKLGGEYVVGSGFVGEASEGVVIDGGNGFVSDVGLVAYYPFDGDASDVVGGNDGVVFGVSSVEGKIGGAYSFDGVDDYIELGNSIVMDNTDSTISWRMKTTDSNHQNIFAWRIGGIEGRIDRFSSNTIIIESFTNNIWYQYFLTGPVAISDGTWHTYTLVFGSSNSYLYVDGELVGSPLSYNNDAFDMNYKYIGHQQSQPNYGGWFAGVLDEIRVYDRALNAEEIGYLHRYN